MSAARQVLKVMCSWAIDNLTEGRKNLEKVKEKAEKEQE